MGILIRDELDVRILVALVCGPLHAYGVIKQIEDDVAALTPADIRSIYRKLPQLTKWGLIMKDGDRKPPTYRLTAKTYTLLKAHSGRMDNLSRMVIKRLRNR